MKFYWISQKESYTRYATHIAIGSWSEGILCPECRKSTEVRLPPLQVEWQEGSDEIADFSWSSSISIVRHNVFQFLKDQGFEYQFEKVEYVKPDEKLKRGETRVSYPYTGPRLRWLRAGAKLKCNLERSNIYIERTCMTCNFTRFKFQANGIIIDADQWNGEKMFCVEPNGSRNLVHVTEEGRTLIEEAGFTNIAFEECGYIDV